ncbi:MAG: MFS family permease [Candidatus Azotimanducaceae bacterium]|jgi:MFS family permease
MNTSERTTAAIVSLLYFVRMLGLFSILPVFTLAASKLYGSGPMLIGLTLGIYGLFQALLQVPYGYLSDRFGRKPMFMTGLTLFIIGSLVAALAERIEWVLVGRALQGSGAIAGVLLAVLADGMRFEYRARAMAMVGGSIGLAFGGSLVLGPLLYAFGGLQALFYLAAVTGALALLLVIFVLPTSKIATVEAGKDVSPGEPGGVLHNPQLQMLNLSIFMNHYLLMSSFLVIPILLTQFGVAIDDHALYYLGILLGSFLLMLPLVIRWRGSLDVLVKVMPAIAVIVVGFLVLAWSPTLALFVAAVLVFFVGFNYLEATLPALVSNVAPTERRGAAMGIYSASQFLGIFAGGSVGGLLIALTDITTLLVVNAALSAIWAGILIALQRGSKQSRLQQS